MTNLPTTLTPLASQRLRLREMHDNDLEALFAIYGDSETMRYASDPVFPDRTIVALMLDSVRRLRASGASLEWAIADRESDRLIGVCGIHSYQPATHTAEIGGMLIRELWGRGYMPEALQLVIDYARSQLALAWLLADIHPSNDRSLQLFRGLGFEHAKGTIHSLKL